ncbi:unnamed protein product [Clavelina lepadiformis]|uniref:Uncharacterized protein n=1 Tax=Clavelina lepadiformis TaxID=159417 RepID=A0ABP0G046_CLALP
MNTRDQDPPKVNKFRICLRVCNRRRPPENDPAANESQSEPEPDEPRMVRRRRIFRLFRRRQDVSPKCFSTKSNSVK